MMIYSVVICGSNKTRAFFLLFFFFFQYQGWNPGSFTCKAHALSLRCILSLKKKLILRYGLMNLPRQASNLAVLLLQPHE
jgi:hypothetical protein